MHVLPPNPQTPFDMEEFMHMSSSYDMDKVMRTAANVPPIARHVPSERAGGESRREILKSRAKNISRSVCETFAYATSRTISAEDTAVILETFANVRLSVEMFDSFSIITYYAYGTHITYSLNSIQTKFHSGQCVL